MELIVNTVTFVLFAALGAGISALVTRLIYRKSVHYTKIPTHHERTT